MIKNQKGITLIALVITIIVLLILAGVSIAMLTGPNGLLTQASNAKIDTKRAEIVEKINLSLDVCLSELMADDTPVATDVPDVNGVAGYTVTINSSTDATPVEIKYVATKGADGFDETITGKITYTVTDGYNVEEAK